MNSCMASVDTMSSTGVAARPGEKHATGIGLQRRLGDVGDAEQHREHQEPAEDHVDDRGDPRGEVSCAVTSRGGWTSTRQTTATTAMPEDMRIEAARATQRASHRATDTATMAGNTACAPVIPRSECFA